MYYCNTCSQPLCSSCRELTHRARMFSHHEIVSMAKRTKAKHTKCCESHLTHAPVHASMRPSVQPSCLRSSPRGSLHPLLHGEQVASLHQVFPGHAGVSGSCRAPCLPRGVRSSDRGCPLRESRTHCIDIETAYVQGCEMLDQAVLVSLAGLQTCSCCHGLIQPPPPSTCRW